MRSRRSMRESSTKFSASFFRYSSKRAHLDGAAGAPARREEPMAVGDGPRRDVLHARARRDGQARDRERHDAAAVEEQQPPDRPAEDELALAVLELGVPVHRLRERQVAQHLDEHVRQRVDRRLAAVPLRVREVLAARRVELDDARRSRSRACARIPRPAFVGMALGVERRRDTGGPITTSSRSSCRSIELRHAGRQPARRRVRFDRRPSRASPASVSRVFSRSASSRRRAAGSHDAGISSTPISSSSSRSMSASFSGRSDATQACAIATASCRTRRM